MVQINKEYNKVTTQKINIKNQFDINGTTVTSSAAELNLNDNQPATITFVVGTESTNAINVTGQVADAAGTDMATVTAFKFYLADDATGLTPSATAPDGGIAIGTDGALIESVANLSGTLVTEADGDFDITLTETGAATWYLVVVMPNGSLEISDAITFAA